MKKFFNKSNSFQYAIYATVITFVIRFIGIWHSFPFILHPDEPTVVRSALGVRFFPNPAHFDWPHLYIYVNFGIYKVYAFIRDFLYSQGLYTLFSETFPLMWNDDLIFYWLTRLLSIVLGAFTVVPVYLTAKKLFDKKVAIVSSFIIALIPFHIWHSQYSLIDVPMVFFMSWALYFSSCILYSSKLKNYILGGLFVGLAASTKYNGALSAIVIVLAHLYRCLSPSKEVILSETEFVEVKNSELNDGVDITDVKIRAAEVDLNSSASWKSLISIKSIKELVVSGLMSILGFLVGTPYALFDYETFIRTDGPKGALWQFTNVGKVGFSEQLYKFFTYFFIKLSDDFGYTFIFCYLVLFLWIVLYYGLHKKSFQYLKELMFLYIPSFFFFFYIAGFAKSRSHYYLITYPFVAILAGFFIVSVYVYLNARNRRGLATWFVLSMFLLPIVIIGLNTSKRLSNIKINRGVSVENEVRMVEAKRYNILPFRL